MEDEVELGLTDQFGLSKKPGKYFSLLFKIMLIIRGGPFDF